MQITILSRGAQLYSTQSLVNAVRRRRQRVEVIDFMHCQIISGAKPGIWFDGDPLVGIHGVIPRVGSSVTSQGAAIIRQFEVMGVASTMQAEALLKARDKLWSSQLLQAAGLRMPKTVFSGFTYHTQALIRAVGGLPVVLKLLQGTHGMGVVLLKDEATALSVIEAMFRAKQKFVLQEYIEESSGTDIRAIVINGEVVAAMKRQAQDGEFRANLHRGGEGFSFHLTSEQEEAAIRAAGVLGLEVAGVDMLMSRKGPLLLEVNASPGLEGIETVTRVDVAGKIVDHLLDKLT